MDIISNLGEMAFASRLKQLGERLSKDVSLLYNKLNIDFEARWFVILYSLMRRSPMTVTGLAESLGISHTAVRQLLDEMADKELVTWSKGQDDRRKQMVSLTQKSKKIAQQLSPVWDEIRKATKELIDASGFDIITGLKKIEKQLDERNMYERIWLRLNGKLPADIEICEYSPAMKKYFKELNYEWLKEYFSVEISDEKTLSNPNEKIVKKGGVILFARIGNEIVGTCALIKHKNGIFELLKMAVTKKYRGRGIGKKLLKEIISRAQKSGATELYLRTSSKLEQANCLYQNEGFVKVERNPFPGKSFQRKTFTMKMEI
ncbi:MAG: bifunctional helix-turn-helix transcriptional regulator/GNAT family N-acetyltransferase [Ignavibacteria bacterium]|jgi:DNA-binding MarR family transcriptional regulator/N-acetylglutamate synthase-like GNAT family acetyltransferase